MYEVLVGGLTFLAIVAIGSAILTGVAARKRKLRTRLEGSWPASDTRKTLRGRAPFTGALHRIGTFVSHRGPSANLKQELARAGYHGTSAPYVYLGTKIFLLVVGLLSLLVLLLLAGFSPWWCVFLALIGGATMNFLPNMIVFARRRHRRTEVRHRLPDVIDLLEICVSAGMGLDMAWNLVGDEIRRVSSILADEMALTNLEIHLGAPRAVAMRHLAERTEVEDIGSLVAVLIQSERFGASVSETLRAFASSMRESRSMNAQEAAERMAVRLLFPMVLFIFPAVLIVLVGPAGLKLAKMITGS